MGAQRVEDILFPSASRSLPGKKSDLGLDRDPGCLCSQFVRGSPGWPFDNSFGTHLVPEQGLRADSSQDKPVGGIFWPRARFVPSP